MEYRDPVCGLMVDPALAAAESLHGTQHYYFCSTACRDRFESNPAQYLGSALTGAGDTEFEKHEPPRTTVDGMTAPKYGAASSGGGEYDPVPERHKYQDKG